MNFLKSMPLLVLITVGCVFSARGMDLENIRANYGKAATDKKLCQTMIEQLKAKTESATHQAYLGAFQTI